MEGEDSQFISIQSIREDSKVNLLIHRHKHTPNMCGRWSMVQPGSHRFSFAKQKNTKTHQGTQNCYCQ